MSLFQSSLRTLGILNLFLLSVTAQDPTSYFGGINNSAYLDWLQGASYERSTFLPSITDPDRGAAMHWTANATHLILAIAAMAEGWVGFGIAESGSMRGADIILFTAETNELVDSYVLDDLVTPFPDDCQSWTLHDSFADGGFIIFQASRLLDTGDTQDRSIINDSSALVPPTRVIAAWGDSSVPSYHGDNKARTTLRFFGADSGEEIALFENIMQDEAEGSFVIRANNYSIPAIETMYKNFCFSAQDLADMGVPVNSSLHTIGVEPLVDPRARQYVHHFVVTASEDPLETYACDNEFPGLEMAYVWAPGDLPLNFPSNVGGPLGEGGFKSFKIEIHYNNPSLNQGALDSSGIRLYYTSQKRKYDLGIFQTGDPQVQLFGQKVSPNGGLAQHTFDCSGTCSSLFITEPVTVLAEHLHMHEVGKSISNVQIRNGEIIRQGQVQFWDFSQQGNQLVVQEPFDIQPGDSFQTICDYKPTQDGQVFGLGSGDEMCIAFLYYYPRQVLQTDFGTLPYICGFGFDFFPACDANWTERDLTSLTQRTFGTAPATCPLDSGATPAPTPDEMSGAFLPSARVFVVSTLLAALLVVV